MAAAALPAVPAVPVTADAVLAAVLVAVLPTRLPIPLPADDLLIDSLTASLGAGVETETVALGDEDETDISGGSKRRSVEGCERSVSRLGLLLLIISGAETSSTLPCSETGAW